MSRLSSELAATRPLPFAIPAELEAAWAWMEAQGHEAVRADGSLVLTPYPDDGVLGVVFDSAADLEGLLPGDEESMRRVVPLGEFAGDGSTGLLWQDDDGSIRVAVISSEGEANLLADSALDFLRLVAIGYAELLPLCLTDRPDDADSIDGVADFRRWVGETYDVVVPEQWYDVSDDDAFTAWVADAWGQPLQDPEPPATAAVPEVPMTGGIETLLAAVGTPDGSPEIEALAALVGIALTDGALKRSAPALRSVGLEASFSGGRLDTVFVTVVSDDRAAFPRADDLVQGVTTHSGREEVEALLGTPEASGEYGGTAWLRYATAGGFVRFGFASGRVTEVTVMLTAP